MTKNLDLLFTIGRPFSPLYGAAMKIREMMYRKGYFRSQNLSVPVISVGNLVLGGSGKTPTVQYIAALLQSHGRKPAVISRGYGGTAGDDVNIVSDGERILLPPRAAGDEPYMLSTVLKNVPVVTGRRRILPCRHAARELGADVLILDDGFQHLAVRRDIDFVLFDATFLAGNSRIFPGGPLREPVSSLKRCDAFIVTGLHENNAERAKKFRELLSDRFPGKPVFSAFQGEPELVDRAGNRSAALPGKQYYAICGIANPARFSESLKRLGVKLCGVHNLRDHAAYSQILMTRICSEAAAAGADSLVTTNKDYVKMQTLDVELPVYVLDPGFTMEDGFSSFLMERLDVLQPRAEP